MLLKFEKNITVKNNKLNSSPMLKVLIHLEIADSDM